MSEPIDFTQAQSAGQRELDSFITASERDRDEFDIVLWRHIRVENRLSTVNPLREYGVVYAQDIKEGEYLEYLVVWTSGRKYRPQWMPEHDLIFEERSTTPNLLGRRKRRLKL